MVLIFMALMLIIVFAAMGVAVDISRALATRSSAQSSLEAAALTAVMELDGSPDGIQRARATALRLAGSLAAVEVTANLVRIRMEVPLEWIVLRSSGKHAAQTAAVQLPLEEVGHGLLPYSVLAHDPSSTDLGLRHGEIYTLRWAAQPSLAAGNVCRGDAGLLDGAFPAPLLLGPADRSLIRRAILDSRQSSPLKIGDAVKGSEGILPLEREALAERVRGDADYTSADYASYIARGRGNGRRIAAAAIHSPGEQPHIAGFGAFFLLPASGYQAEGDQPFCAEFIGSYLQGSTRRGAAGTGFLVARLSR